MATAAGTRARIVVTAARLFRQQGVTGTGLLTILEEAGAPRGSLYHHFPGGKEELVVEALRYEAERVTADLTVLTAGRCDEATALGAFAEALAVSLETSDFRLGCPVSTAALELSAVAPAVRQVCADTYATWQALVAEHLRTVGYGPDDARHRAELVLAAFEGAMLIARATRDGDVLRRTAAALSPR
jgi:TetR/AcrR family transcriptional repressor of lmrAB and yxaGH operons